MVSQSVLAGYLVDTFSGESVDDNNDDISTENHSLLDEGMDPSRNGYLYAAGNKELLAMILLIASYMD